MIKKRAATTKVIITGHFDNGINALRSKKNPTAIRLGKKAGRGGGEKGRGEKSL